MSGQLSQLCATFHPISSAGDLSRPLIQKLWINDRLPADHRKVIARSEQLRDRLATFGQKGCASSMNDIRRIIEWLSFHPTSDDIARALVTDYLVDHGVIKMRFGRINSDDSAIALGQYGYEDADQWHNLVVPGTEWRSWDIPAIHIMTGKNNSRWAPDSKLCVVTLRDRGVIQGNAVFEFSRPIPDDQKDAVMEIIDDLCVPIALYQSFQNRGVSGLPAQLGVVGESRDAGAGQLTQRQILILRGMVEGKTNHELATEMGFSVSTIRHETMRIYQALAVSDRKEAAKKALMLSLI
jgi:DNA-binding CsgD family transcriptional regulator